MGEQARLLRIRQGLSEDGLPENGEQENEDARQANANSTEEHNIGKQKWPIPDKMSDKSLQRFKEAFIFLS